MIRRELADRLLADHEEAGYVSPAYGDYCFGSVPGTLDAMLEAEVPAERTLPEDVFAGVERAVENVVCVLLDGYGFDAWIRDHESVPLLSRLSDRGTVTPLTSVYPSETAAAITTLHTGLYPVEHGLIGWNVYYEEAGGVVQPLPYTTPTGDPSGEVEPAAAAIDAEPDPLFEGRPRYDRLRDAGASTTLHQPAKIVGGPYTEATTAGTAVEGADNPTELALSMRRQLEAGADGGPQYVQGYFPEVDAAAHAAGTASDDYRAQLEATTEAVRREVVDRLDPAVADRTLFVLAADHGHVDTGENVDLRTGFETLWESLRRGPDGDPIPPVGSGRNVHLHLRDGAVGAVRAELEAELDCVTYTREEALARNLFGPADPSATFERLCGDLILVHRDSGVWHEDASLDHVGMHGGLTREEMLVPFAAATVGDLQ